MIWQQLKKIGIFVSGMVVIILGIILLPLPGPGLLIILGGLVLLAREFSWAKRYVDRLKANLKRLRPSRNS